MQTLCATGIRVSELPYITVEAVERGRTTVRCKGKNRVILLPKRLREELQLYVFQNQVQCGPVFVTRYGNPLNRSNIWREMKQLCVAAGVSEQKVFPHNLRHLFARSFYLLDKDIAKLADILGHSSIDTTRIYIISSGEEHQKKLDCMDLVL